MLQDIPVYVNMQSLSAGEIFAAVHEQAKSSLAHKDYPYISLDEKMLAEDKLCVLYQRNIYESWLKIICEEKLVDMANKKAGSQNILDVEIMETYHCIDMMFDYAAHRYKPESIQKINGGRL